MTALSTKAAAVGSPSFTRRTRKGTASAGNAHAAARGLGTRAHFVRHVPLMLLTTSGVSIAPAALVVAVVRPQGALVWVGSALLAGALSACMTAVGAAAWKRFSHINDLVFSELLPWGFARRSYVELRLRGMRSAYDLAARRNAHVRTEQLEGLARLQASRVPYTHGHCQRVASHAERIARAMRLSPASVAKVRTAALIHDVGKVFTPTSILNKPGPLTASEFTVIKRHADDGAQLARGARDAELVEIVRHDHERVNGSGYPDGLVGQTIPLGARIVAVADTFDAVTSHRPYRPTLNQREGLALLRAERGVRLDATAVDAFLSSYCPRRSIVSLAAASAAFARCVGALKLAPLFGGPGAGTAALAPALAAAGIVAAAAGAVHTVRLSAADHGAQRLSAPPLAAPRGASLSVRGGLSRGAPNPQAQRPSPTRAPRARALPPARHTLGSGSQPARPALEARSATAQADQTATQAEGQLPRAAPGQLPVVKVSPQPPETTAPVASPPTPTRSTLPATIPTVPTPTSNAPAITAPVRSVPPESAPPATIRP
jgi:putative nucleotidyltransferase with HDIG domain